MAAKPLISGDQDFQATAAGPAASSALIMPMMPVMTATISIIAGTYARASSRAQLIILPMMLPPDLRLLLFADWLLAIAATDKIRRILKEGGTYAAYRAATLGRRYRRRVATLISFTAQRADTRLRYALLMLSVHGRTGLMPYMMIAESDEFSMRLRDDYISMSWILPDKAARSIELHITILYAAGHAAHGRVLKLTASCADSFTLHLMP